MPDDDFKADWAEWHASRLAGVSGPLGVASLDSTNWLSSSQAQVDGVAGRWHGAGNKVHGEGLTDSGYRLVGSDGLSAIGDHVELSFGEELRDGQRLLRAFGRGDMMALRVFDPATPRRMALQGIAAYEPDPDWRVVGTFLPGNGAEIDIAAVDGHVSREELGGTIELAVAGHDFTLTVTPAEGGQFSGVFGDSTNGVETYRFRFLRVDGPDENGHTVVDFNRAYLPPCAFSDHYICPLPPPGNRYDFPIRVGERVAVYAD